MNSAIRGNRNERRTWCGVSGQSFVKQGTSILLGLPRNNKQKKGPEINKKVEEQKIRDSIPKQVVKHFRVPGVRRHRPRDL